MKRGIDVVGVSGDRQDVSDRFRDELGLPFPLVGDPGAKIISGYGVKWPLVKMSARVTFIVERNRKVAAARKSARDIDSHVQLACSHNPASD